jgi:hypothetical protein
VIETSKLGKRSQISRGRRDPAQFGTIWHGLARGEAKYAKRTHRVSVSPNCRQGRD